MRNIKLILEYDGTNYAGFQRQKNAVTIQQTLEQGIYNITKEKIETIGSSRTDSGVHARGFVCNFSTNSKIPAEKLREAINSKLPKDIVVLNSEEVALDFHARYSSKGKVYSYTIINRKVPPAIYRNYVYHYKGELDINLMKKACEFFIGTHDFSAFKNTGSSVKTTVRTIKEAYITEEDDKIRFYVSGDGFLYNMVRIMVGTLIEVGSKKIAPEYIKQIIEGRDRSKAGKSVPAGGLCLEQVFY